MPKKFYCDVSRNDDAKWLYEMFIEKKFSCTNPPTPSQLAAFSPAVQKRFADYNQKALCAHIKKIAQAAEVIMIEREATGIDAVETNESSELEDFNGEERIETPRTLLEKPDAQNEGTILKENNLEIVLPHEIWSWIDGQSKQRVTLRLELLSGISSISHDDFQCKILSCGTKVLIRIKRSNHFDQTNVMMQSTNNC